MIICHGHQGGGKAKVIAAALNHLLHLGTVEAGGGQSAGGKLLAGESILQTLAINSNRLVHVSFNRSGLVTGGTFDFSWLPLKTNFAKMWRSYHVLTWLVAGLRSKGKVRELGLHLLLEEGDMAPPGQDQVEQFRTFVKNLKTVGFREDLGMKVVFKVLVSEVLLFRLKEKVEKEAGGESSPTTSQALLQAVASNLEVEPGLLWRTLNEETPLGGERLASISFSTTDCLTKRWCRWISAQPWKSRHRSAQPPALMGGEVHQRPAQAFRGGLWQAESDQSLLLSK